MKTGGEEGLEPVFLLGSGFFTQVDARRARDPKSEVGGPKNPICVNLRSFAVDFRRFMALDGLKMQI